VTAGHGRKIMMGLKTLPPSFYVIYTKTRLGILRRLESGVFTQAAPKRRASAPAARVGGCTYSRRRCTYSRGRVYLSTKPPQTAPAEKENFNSKNSGGAAVQVLYTLLVSKPSGVGRWVFAAGSSLSVKRVGACTAKFCYSEKFFLPRREPACAGMARFMREAPKRRVGF
jgi:hypothetical protein